MRLFQVGAGSGGIVVLDLVTRDPRVTAVTLVEPDVYKPHNVHRHVFPPSSVGRPKADLAAEWVRERRPDVHLVSIRADLTDPSQQVEFGSLAAGCDIGICAVDNEPAKYAFDALMRKASKPWTLGEVLSGGIGGWVHRFTPDGPCYGCVASHLRRTVTEEAPAPPPDYSNPGGPVVETTVPATKASIEVIAGLHAVATLAMMANREGVPPAPTEPTTPAAGTHQNLGGLTPSARQESDATSLLFTLARVPGVFEDAFRSFRFRVLKSAACLFCSAVPPPAVGEDLDVALDQALARLGDN